MSSSIFLFPGQGSQFPGMAEDLYGARRSVRELFDMASQACGRDMASLLFKGSEGDLKQTENAQPAIVLASLSAREALAESGVESGGAAGHSLGEYCALVEAGVLSSEDALRAVAARGAFMASAAARILSDKGPVGMAAVIGIGPSQVLEAISGLDDVWSANENSLVQVAIGGTLAGMNAAEDALKSAGARRIVPLKVSCPFHTPLMAEPAQSMEEFLGTVTFAEPTKPVWSNVTAKPVVSGDEARALLVEQITHPVRWVDLMASVAQTKPGALYEVGPGTVLKGLWGKTDHGGEFLSAGTDNDICRIAQSHGSLEE